MRQFAETEIRIPTGPDEGLLFKLHRQPAFRLWFDGLESGLYRFIDTLGPTQSGKSFHGFVVPLMYHLFEIGEDVVCGVPSTDLVDDKWRDDILPAIEASRFRTLLPKSGPGSQGGKVSTAITFQNGATLRFMTGGGGDKSRAGKTTRVLVVTETDGMDSPGISSREGSKLDQLVARTLRWNDRAICYFECTVSIEAGFIWQAWLNGTRSRIALLCPLCRHYVTPEREHLTGWQNAQNLLDAIAMARLRCPHCNGEWKDADRRSAHDGAILLHHGQTAETPELGIVGNGPRTDTLSFRYTAANNLFTPLGAIAAAEWKAAHGAHPDADEKTIRQCWWALPYLPDKTDLTGLDVQTICRRQLPQKRGVMPPDAGRITLGIDIGKWLCHWIAYCWRPGFTPHVIDYGVLDVHADDMAVEIAIRSALRDFRDNALALGFGLDADAVRPSLVVVDSGWWASVIYEFAAESGPGIIASKGFGFGQIAGHHYHSPKNTGSIVVQLGDQYHVSLLSQTNTLLLEFDADSWKTRVHERLKTPIDLPGAMTLFADLPEKHLKLAHHLTAEKQVDEFVAGKGRVVKWVAGEGRGKQNHWLDAAVLGLLGGHLLGERLIAQPISQTADKPYKIIRPSFLPTQGQQFRK